MSRRSTRVMPIFATSASKEAIEAAGLKGQVKVMIGGAPVTESYAKQIGADGYAEDAISAVDMALRLMDAPA